MTKEIAIEGKMAENNTGNGISDIYSATFECLKEAERFYKEKQYEEAIEAYSWALERLVEARGEASLANADVVYAYGRALFYSAVKKSGIFGGAILSLKDAASQEATQNIAQEKSKEHMKKNFSFSSDESSEEEIMKEDDFRIAWETLDFARILYQKILYAVKNKQIELLIEFQKVPEQSEIQKKLADTYDLLGEISLENAENFQQASIDFQSALDLKSQVYSLESSLISEAHYKLALALEFLEGDNVREKAIEHVGWAIKSLEKRIEIKQQSEKGKEKQTKEIDNMQEMLLELRQKIDDLQKPFEKLKTITPNFENIIGKSQDNVKRTLPEIISNVNDLNSLVKKKKKTTSCRIPKSDDENTLIEDSNKEINISNSNLNNTKLHLKETTKTC
ncbi:hypothetical protein PMAC_003060 [Pneumocystis sp. 'macacae']|nr:hypothetical protein PMAC_003060 [Pneumocystis sp. 'macacae']